jgi:hypothetical protein
VKSRLLAQIVPALAPKRPRARRLLRPPRS